MQDPDFVESFYCLECGAEGDIEHEMGDGYEVKFCPFCGSELKIEDEFEIINIVESNLEILQRLRI